MKRLLALSLLFSLVALPAFAQGEDYNCDAYPDIPVNVTPVMGEATFDYSTNIGGLRALANAPNHLYEQLLMGVTTFQPTLEVINHPQEIKLPDGRECVRIMSVDIKIGYESVVMHIASEIPQGSCGFAEVVAHEQKHAALNQQDFQAYIPQIQQKLKDYLKLNGVLQERNYGYAMTVLHTNMKAIVEQVLQDMNQQDQARQRQVDSPDEFRQMATSCNGQLGLIARQFRMTGQ